MEVVSAFLGLSVLAYLIGWQQTSSYYSTLGAPWIIDMLGSAKLMRASIQTIGIVMVCAYVSICSISMSEATYHGMRWWAIGTMVIGVVFWNMKFYTFESIDIKTKTLLLSFSGTFLAASAGLTFAEIVARYKHFGLQWSGYYVWLLYFVVIQAFIWAPSNSGEAAARGILENASFLPLVDLGNEDKSMPWRLLEISEGMAVIMLTGTLPNQNSYKVVPITELKGIASTLRAPK
jgi:hypothetical protein